MVAVPRKALLVSAWHPARPGALQSGLYRRLTIMIDAIKRICPSIEALFYLPHHESDPSPDQAREIERDLSKHWDVDVQASFCRRDPPRVAEGVKTYLKSSSSFFRLPGYSELSGPRQIAALDKCLARHPDLVFIHRLQCTAPLMRTRQVLPPIFFDLDDIEHVAILRHLSQPPHWWRTKLGYLHIPALVWGERKAVKLSSATFVCSDLDRRKLAELFGASNIVAIPNAVALPEVTDLSLEPRIIMLGNYEYLPNRLGAEVFLNRIWPLILSACPDAEAIFAGHRVDAILHYAQPPARVIFPGFVEDLDALYRRARLVICPILSGGGTRVKIMEAAAYGRPVVSTTMGAEGIDLIDGKEILLRDSPQNFAGACIELLSNFDTARMIGLAARTAVARKYDRARIVGELATLLGKAMKR